MPNTDVMCVCGERKSQHSDDGACYECECDIFVEIGGAADIERAKIVDVVIRSDAKTIWVNVNGVCKLRIGNIENLQIDDRR